MSNHKPKEEGTIRKDDGEVVYNSVFHFLTQFKVEGNGDLYVKVLNLQTSGRLLDWGSNLRIEQTLFGEALLSKNELRGLSSSVGIAYEQLLEISKVTALIKDIAQIIYGQHLSVISKIEGAYRSGNVLPKKIGPLNLID